MHKKFISFLLISSFISAVSCSSMNKKGEISVTNTTEPEQSSTNAEAAKDDTVILLTSLGSIPSQYKKAVNEFNELDNGYRVELKDYEQYLSIPPSDYIGNDLDELIDEAYETFSEKLVNDFCENVTVDIISYSTDSVIFEKLKKDGSLENLYQFIEEDDQFDITELNGTLVDMCETDGKLFELPVSYDISTMIGAREYINKQEQWGVTDLINCYDSTPEGLLFTESNTRFEAYRYLVGYNQKTYIEDLHGDTVFNSEELRYALRFCMRFDYNSRILTTENENDPYLVKGLLNIQSFAEFHSEIESFEKRNGESVIVGFPSSKGYYSNIDIMESYGINANSPDDVKKGAWEFLKFISSSNQQSEFSVGFPVNNSSFNVLASEKIEEGYLTQKEYDELSNCINNTICRITPKDKYYNSIFEETTNYLNGSLSLDECINDIIEKTN